MRLRSYSIRFWESQFEDSARDDKRNVRDEMEIDGTEREMMDMQGLCMILQDSSGIWQRNEILRHISQPLRPWMS